MSLKEKDCLKKLDIKIVILSRGRSNSIKNNTLKFFPDWVEVVVPESQKEEYEEKISNPVITTPNNVLGLGKLRNWVLEEIEEETVVMVDDDINCVYCLTGAKSRRVDDKEEVIQLIINAAVMAKDLGISTFGFGQSDIRRYKSTDPFILNTWVGCVIGVIGRKYEFRDDKFKVDIDYCLQNLLVDRILWCDNRYWFSQERDNNIGGNSEFRTEESIDESMESLFNRWKPYLSINRKRYRNNVSISMNIARRQAVKYE